MTYILSVEIVASKLPSAASRAHASCPIFIFSRGRFYDPRRHSPKRMHQALRDYSQSHSRATRRPESASDFHLDFRSPSRILQEFRRCPWNLSRTEIFPRRHARALIPACSALMRVRTRSVSCARRSFAISDSVSLPVAFYPDAM